MKDFAKNSLHIIDRLSGEQITKNYKTENGAQYPKGEIGNRLQLSAQPIKADLGARILTIDLGGWDTHKNQEGTLNNLFGQLAQGLFAFTQDLNTSSSQSPGKRVTVVVMSEFGRRLKENGNQGTDHGHGNVMMVFGEQVNGGQVFGKWPGLANEQLFEHADLAVTTDFRNVLAEIVSKRLALPSITKIFPTFKMGSSLGSVLVL